MAMLTGAKLTYDDTTRREDLLDLIQDVSPDANYLTTVLGSSTASQTLHEWADYYESRPTTNGAKTIEGNEATAADLTEPTRRSNICQIITDVFAVTETTIAVNKISPRDSYSREMGLAMRRWKMKAEYAVLRGTIASGSSGVAREMQGLIAATQAIGTTSVRASGTSLGQQEISDIMAESWSKTDEYLVNLLLTTGARKLDFGKMFTTSSPKTIAATDKRLVQALDVIESDFGNLVQVRAHRDMPTGGLLGLNTELQKLAYLRRPKHQAVGITGDSRKGFIVGELTLEYNTRPNVYRSGYVGV